MSTTTTKGTVHSWPLGFNGYNTDMDNDLKRLDAWALVAWSNKVSTTTGLTYGYHGGPVFTAGAFSMVADGTVALTDNATNYVERTPAGTVSKNTTAFTVTSVPMAKVTTVSGAITTIQDFRGVRSEAREEVIIVAVSDEATAITTGTAKVTFRMPFAMTLTALPRASLTVASSSGTPTVDINEGGTTILSTKLTIDASELTSTTAATPAVISDANLADDAEMTIDIDVAGTGAKGLKVALIGVRA